MVLALDPLEILANVGSGRVGAICVKLMTAIRETAYTNEHNLLIHNPNSIESTDFRLESNPYKKEFLDLTQT